MACFIVPAAEAIVVTAAAIVMKKKEEKLEMPKLSGEHASFEEEPKKLTKSRELKWLANLLWGGVLLLAFEHLWHGEIVPWPPFLTAMESQKEMISMLKEMATVGTAMAATVTVVWGCVVTAVKAKIKKAKKELSK